MQTHWLFALTQRNSKIFSGCYMRCESVFIQITRAFSPPSRSPPDFYLNPEDDFDESYTDCYVDFRSLSFYRLLNIAEMAHKYSFRSFECWAIHQICRTLRFPTPRKSEKGGTSSAASSATLIPMSGNNKPDLDSPSLLEEPLEISDETDELYSRLLLIALTCDHPSLLHYLVQKLVTKILWYNHVPGVLLVRMLEQHRRHPALATLLGVVYYRILIDMPQTSDNDGDYIPEPQPIFPPTINVERRMQFLAAHHRLTQAWRNISSSPPVLHSSCSPGRCHNSSRKALQHTSCQESWRYLWRTASHQAESRSFIHYSGAALGSSAKNTHVGSSADVLGLLKIMMLQLRKLTASTSSICMDCSLEGLEAVDLRRDQLIEGLINMFVYEQWSFVTKVVSRQINNTNEGLLSSTYDWSDILIAAPISHCTDEGSEWVEQCDAPSGAELLIMHRTGRC